MAEEQIPYNAADAQAVAKRQKSSKTRDLQASAALRRIMSDEAGRLWMWDLLTRCGTFHLSFSRDALVMAFNEGRRDIGNHLIGEINRLSPQLYMRMAVENSSMPGNSMANSSTAKDLTANSSTTKDSTTKEVNAKD